MRYLELPPSAALAPYVRCVWIFEAEAPVAEPQRIVPDGRAELIVHYRAAYAEGGEPQPGAVFAGQLTRPLWLRATGPSGVLGVRFHPAAARCFAGMPMYRANDRRIDLDALWPGQGTKLASDGRRADDDPSRAAIATGFVAQRIAAGPPLDDAVVRCCALLESTHDDARVAALCALAGLGRRQLERRFRDAVGVGPALLASILRLRTVFDLIERDSDRPWTDAALAAGYFDQSHFIRDFRRLVGCTPTEFLAATPGIASTLVAH